MTRLRPPEAGFRRGRQKTEDSRLMTDNDNESRVFFIFPLSVEKSDHFMAI